jgi:hypothetical protein
MRAGIAAGCGLWPWMLACTLQAQPHGYLGQRMPLAAELTVSPGVLDALVRREGLPVYWRGGLAAEYVLTPDLSANLHLHRYGAPLRYSYQSIQGNARLQGWALGPGWSLYRSSRRSTPAPLGAFTRLDVLMLRYQITDLNRRFYQDQRRVLARLTTVMAGLTFGVQRFSGDHIAWRAGAQVGWVFKLPGPDDTPEVRYLRDLATARLRSIWSWGLMGGGGVLWF